MVSRAAMTTRDELLQPVFRGDNCLWMCLVQSQFDFTADWCITCKANERFALDTTAVRQAFAQNQVVVLRADWTHGDPEITQILKEHGRAGVPMYLFYPGGKDRPPVVLPELISSQTVLDDMKASSQTVADARKAS
jgi:thiol:disulfide interchange protein